MAPKPKWSHDLLALQKGSLRSHIACHAEPRLQSAAVRSRCHRPLQWHPKHLQAPSGRRPQRQLNELMTSYRRSDSPRDQRFTCGGASLHLRVPGAR